MTNWQQSANESERLVYRIRPAKRWITQRKGLIEKMGEAAGKEAFREELRRFKGFLQTKNYNELISDIKLILDGKENEIR